MTKELSIYKELSIIKDKEIERLNKFVLHQQEVIADLQQYLMPPKYKKGDIINVLGFDDIDYVIDDFVCYDNSFAFYNVHAKDDLSLDLESFETVLEIDIIPVKRVVD